MIKEKLFGIFGKKPSKKTKKIITTAVITFLVFAFFIWLGIGMYVSVPEGSRGELWPMYIMYGIFPLLIFIFGARRVYDILKGEDDEEEEEETPDEDEEDSEEENKN